MENRLINFTAQGDASREIGAPFDESDRLEKPVTFYENPFYDKVFMLMLSIKIRTYQTKNKARLTEYKSVVSQLVSKVGGDRRFPYSGDMLLNLHFTGPRESMAQLDVDNMAKLLIDRMKGIIMTDDNRVRMLWVEKSLHETTGCKVGIKFIPPGNPPILMPPLQFSEDEMASMLAEQGLSLDDLGR